MSAAVVFAILTLTLSWVDFGFVFGGGVQGSAVWRSPLALQAVFPLVTFAILPFIPESPRWLASKGRNDEVRVVVARLEGKGYRAESDVVIAHSRLIIEAAQHEAEIEASWLDLFRNGELKNLRRMLLGAIPQFIQQFTGINAVVYFGPAIFSASLGLTPRIAAIVGGCGSICFWIGSCTPPFFIEKVGRRPIFLAGLMSTALAMMGLTVATYYAQFPATKVSSGYGALACILLYHFCFGASWAGVPWVYAPEINSLRMRNRAAAIASATEWLSAFVVVVITPVGVANIGWKFYLIWLISCGIALPYMYLTCPETKGATLEEMDRYFATQRSWIVINAKNIKDYNQNHQEDPAQAEKQQLSAQKIEVSG